MKNFSARDAAQMRLYDRQHRRLYINGAERARFLAAAEAASPLQRSLCLTLLYTGCRISEALALTPTAVQIGARVITFRTLKQRDIVKMREVPIPVSLVDLLERCPGVTSAPDPAAPLWQYRGRVLNRVTAYRLVKDVMARAGIVGAQACPKGLRHGYGIHATMCGIQLHMLAKWMGHASLTTTQIYADACGPEERLIAERMWE
ncbi:MAG: site-specific integrase [Pseudomonadota bacterium]